MIVGIVESEGALQHSPALRYGQGGTQVQQVGLNLHVRGVAMGCAADLRVHSTISNIQQHLVVVMPIVVPGREHHLQEQYQTCP